MTQKISIKKILLFVCALLAASVSELKSSNSVAYTTPASGPESFMPVWCGNIAVLQAGNPSSEELAVIASAQWANYQNIGGIKFTFAGHEAYSTYVRTLDFGRGVAAVSYQINKVEYKREMFADFENQAVVWHITASGKQALSLAWKVMQNTNHPFYVRMFNLGGVLDSDKVTRAEALTVVISTRPISPQYLFAQARRSHLKRYEPEYGKINLKLPHANSANRPAMLRFQYSRYQNISKYLSTQDSFFIKEKATASQAIAWAAPFTFSAPSDTDYSHALQKLIIDSSHGVIEVLPRLPEAWAAKGEITGVSVPGGFTIELAWKRGRIKTLVVRSKIGGNCRIKVHNNIEGCKCIGMQPADGPNPNPYYSAGKAVMAPSHSPADGPQRSFTYDFETAPGQVYVLLGK